MKIHHNIWRYAALSLVAGVTLLAAPAQAQFQVFLGHDFNGNPNRPNADAARNSFVGGLLSFATENFDARALGSTPTTVFTGAHTASVSHSGSSGVFRVNQGTTVGHFPISGNRWLQHSGVRTGVLTWTTDQNAFGTYLTDFPDTSTESLVIEVRNNGSLLTSFNVKTELINAGITPTGTSGSNGNAIFFGFVRNVYGTVFDEIRLVRTGGDSFAYDNWIAGTAVPEPSEWAAMGLGILGVGTLIGRGRRRAARAAASAA